MRTSWKSFDGRMPEELIGATPTAHWLSPTSGASWTDRIGGVAFSQGTGANQPTVSSLAGRPALSFDGTTDFMSCTLALGAVCDYLVVIQASSISGTRAIFDGLSSGARHHLRIASSQWQIYQGSSPVGGGTADTGAHVLGVRFGATDSGRADGTQVASGNVGTHTAAGLRIGRQWDSGNFFAGLIAEVLVFDGGLAEDRFASVELWLRRKYGVG